MLKTSMLQVDESTTSSQIMSIIKEAFQSDNGQFKFGIVGLHPCGNLGSMLLKLYNNCSNISFINIVSCCYMKLSFESNLFTGYPLSHVCLKKQFKLDYLSCETACHAIENYVSKLKTENHHHLKIHAFRAGLETILVNINLDLKHSAVGNVKYEENMTFEEYCDRALKKMNVQIPKSKMKDVEKMVEASWEKVVKFYSARLFLAPLVESIILYDRLLYLAESNSHCNIVPVFDCKISPRNHVLRAEKIFAKEY
ncbi:protein RRNAD1 isoform X2 [Sitophilus oryzae]|uniref:Protein RRNAD1 isoform X2 n=1 Tax=Sitophilus oryzae TaxID=7048 RepID=A0A6J2Y0H5_SITOR|nr:protein RRNAD1 isoform X2 [Sitophilus oryzae]